MATMNIRICSLDVITPKTFPFNVQNSSQIVEDLLMNLNYLFHNNNLGSFVGDVKVTSTMGKIE